MKILVAGGAGYVGSALVPALVDHGYEVKVIDLCWFGEPNFDKSVEVIKKDLFNCTEKDFEGIDQCIIIAGISNDPSAEFSPIRNFIYNAAQPPYLAYIAKRAGVRRLIYASTCSVYGYTVDRLFDEESTISCNYPYGVSKLASERGVLHLCDDNFSVICLRKGTISGVSPRMRFDLICNTMTKFALTEGVITVNNPSIWRPILAIQDAVSAYIRSIQCNYSISGVFNIAHDNYTVGEVADIIRQTVLKKTEKKVKVKIKNVSDLRNYKVTIEKAVTTLGFHPRYSVGDIAEDIIDHWDLYKDRIDDINFYNVEVCKKLFKSCLLVECG